MAKVPYAVRVSRTDGAMEILWREGSEEELLRFWQVLLRAADLTRGQEGQAKRGGARTDDD